MFYLSFSVLSFVQCFIFRSVFYLLFSVLSFVQCFIVVSLFSFIAVLLFIVVLSSFNVVLLFYLLSFLINNFTYDPEFPPKPVMGKKSIGGNHN